MIDWPETEARFGYTNPADFVGLKRPKVICKCDSCPKTATIAIRVKSRIDSAGQMAWRCPSCVGLARSDEITAQMTAQWRSEWYRRFNKKYRNDPAYKQNQAKKAHQRWQQDEYRSKLATGIDVERFLTRAKELYGERFDYSETKFGTWLDRIVVRCTECGNYLSKSPQKHLDAGACYYCGGSSGQREIADFIKMFGSECVLNDRVAIAPFELDIYVPERRLAVEHHGSFWHSHDEPETPREKFRHQHKAQLCQSKGIRLIQLFDFEWSDKQPIAKSILTNLLGNSERADARKLEIVDLSQAAARLFFDTNHLYGHRYANINIGLAAQDEIMAAISLSKRQEGFEIIRLATKIGYNVRGGLSRLLSYFRRIHRQPIYTFADLRFSTAAAYERVGFTRLAITRPNYFYIKNWQVLSRQRCQKHKLRDLLPNFSQRLTEAQNMFNHGYRRFWDAGHIKLVLK